MCGGAKYIDSAGKEWKVYFPNPKAALPIVRPDGDVWMKWGTRKEEPSNGFVQGGWARLQSVEEGKWDKYQPERVKLATIAFMEKDPERVSHWFDVPPGKAMEGLIAHINEEARLYVITEPMPAEYAWLHDRWPHLTNA